VLCLNLNDLFIAVGDRKNLVFAFVFLLYHLSLCRLQMFQPDQQICYNCIRWEENKLI
jgi:hypothetical protein